MAFLTTIYLIFCTYLKGRKLNCKEQNPIASKFMLMSTGSEQIHLLTQNFEVYVA